MGAGASQRGRGTPVVEYRVEAVHWDGNERGPGHLQELLNDWAAEGWTLVEMVPTRADTSLRSVMGGSASADTTELAVVLVR